MIAKILLTMAVSFAILTVPDWKPPYAYWENVIQLIGWIGFFGPPILLLLLVFNRLVNLSFRFKE